MVTTNHTERNERIQQFAERYKVVLYRIASELFLGDAKKQSGHILKEHVGLTLHSRALPGSLSFATPNESVTALDQNLAVLFWAKAGARKRIRLTSFELRSLINPTDDLNFVADNITHCMSGNDDKFGNQARIWRVYLTTTSESKTLEQTAGIVESVRSIPVIKPLVEARTYGILVLCETPQKRAAIERAVRKHRVSQQALIEIAVGPTSETIAKAFKKGWEKLND